MAVIALMATLGTLILQAHAALPDHHLNHSKATVCIASLVTAAVIVVSLHGRKRPAALLPSWGEVVVPLLAAAPAGPSSCLASSRAGPPDDTVLRL